LVKQASSIDDEVSNETLSRINHDPIEGADPDVVPGPDLERLDKRAFQTLRLEVAEM
jgi:hypothetical protein